MKFSVIVPVYNVEKYLSTCLNSILDQNYDDYEIIAVDDGSTDNSARILFDFLSKTNKLRIIQQENKGLGGARNTGINAAQGEYLLLVDSDDYIRADALLTIAECLEHNLLDILAFDCFRVEESGKIIEKISVDAYQQKYTQLTKKQFMLLEPTACLKVYKRELFIDHKIQFPERLWYEDFATVYKLVPFAENIGYLKEPFYYYVQQENSITHSKNTGRMMEIVDAFNLEIDYFTKHGLFEEYYEELEWNCALHVLYYSAFRFLTCGYYRKEMQELFKYSKSIFPNIEQNKYVLQMRDDKVLMKSVLNQQYFHFYLHTGFAIKFFHIIKILVPLKRWRQ